MKRNYLKKVKVKREKFDAKMKIFLPILSNTQIRSYSGIIMPLYSRRICHKNLTVLCHLNSFSCHFFGLASIQFNIILQSGDSHDPS